MTDNAPGWQADPTGRHDHRYWDGTQWTEHVSDAGVAATDPYDGDATEVAVAPEPPAAPAPPIAPEPPAAEPTVVTPVVGSDPTASWPTAPVPPVPPAPPSYTPPPVTGGPVGPGGSGGSKRGLLIGGGILAAVAVAVVAFLLLGGGDDDGGDSVRTQLAAQLKSGSGLSNDQAECIADRVVDEMGEDAFDGVDFSADEPPADIQDELFTAAMGSLDACDIDISDFEGDSPTTTEGDDSSGEDGTYGSDPELDALWDDCEAGDYQACDDLYNQSPSGSGYEEFGDTCGNRNEPQGYCVDVYGDGGGDGAVTDLPAGFEEQMADIYENSLGLPADKARCLAARMTEVVSSGELDQDAAMSQFMDYLADCDISLDEISGG